MSTVDNSQLINSRVSNPVNRTILLALGWQGSTAVLGKHSSILRYCHIILDEQGMLLLSSVSEMVSS